MTKYAKISFTNLNKIVEQFETGFVLSGQKTTGNGYARNSSMMSNAAKGDILAINLNILHNYFNATV